MSKRSPADAHVHRIGSTVAIRELGSPARQDIVVALEACGEAMSVAALAQAMDRAADGLYYHLRRLMAAGLVVEVADPHGGAARCYRLAAPAGKRLMLDYEGSDPQRVDAVLQAVRRMLGLAYRDFETAMAQSHAVSRGDARNLWAGRTHGWVARQDLEKVNRLIAELTETISVGKPGKGRQAVSLAFALSPSSRRRGSGKPT